MAHQVVSVKREAVAPCMTCPLCHKLFRDATTIIECLHTFCRKCIYKKLSDEEMECCPICNIDLGCVPLEKLRADHNMQDVRSKIFPSKRIKINVPEVLTPATLPAKRKERSLSSLVVSTPRVSAQSGMTGRRSKSIARKASKGSTFTIEKPAKREEDSVEESESPSSPETMNKSTQNMKQNSVSTEPSSFLGTDTRKENGSEAWDVKVDLWKPLNCLVEAANRSKSLKFGFQGSMSKADALHSQDNEGIVGKTKHKEQRKRLKFQDEKNLDHDASPESERPKKLRKVRPKKASKFGEFRIPPQVLLDAASTKYDRRNYPIWFSLVSDEQVVDGPPLPQIAASYLRIKDGSIPVSFIQKYLKAKLNLSSDEEVEIKCMGQSVIPSLTLNNLLDLWLQTTAPDRVSATIGSSAKEFVMVLGYARRVVPHS